MAPATAELNAQIGHSIDTWLKWRHHTRTELADELQIGSDYLRDKIKGRRPWYFHEVATAAQFLDVPLDDLVGGFQNRKRLVDQGPPPAVLCSVA